MQMAAVAQWQSVALWMRMLRVRPPSAALNPGFCGVLLLSKVEHVV